MKEVRKSGSRPTFSHVDEWLQCSLGERQVARMALLLGSCTMVTGCDPRDFEWRIIFKSFIVTKSSLHQYASNMFC
jgi:hypothetical protein